MTSGLKVRLGSLSNVVVAVSWDQWTSQRMTGWDMPYFKS